MNKLAKIIKELSHEDVVRIKMDLEKGNIDKLINKRLEELSRNKITHCPVCSSPVKEGEGFQLQFGPPGFRKKATFDGLDCLEYFSAKLKKKS